MGAIDYLADRCAECGKSFFQPDTGRRRRYCSNACKQKAYRRAKALEEGNLAIAWARKYLEGHEEVS